MSCKSRMARSAICAAVMALTESGTSCSKSARLRAVTTMHSSAPAADSVGKETLYEPDSSSQPTHTSMG